MFYVWTKNLSSLFRNNCPKNAYHHPKTNHQKPTKKNPTNPQPRTCGLVPVGFTPGSGNLGTMSLASFGAAQVSARFSRRPSPGPPPALRKGSTSSARVEKSSRVAAVEVKTRVEKHKGNVHHVFDDAAAYYRCLRK